jgi:hypothetical protein
MLARFNLLEHGVEGAGPDVISVPAEFLHHLDAEDVLPGRVIDEGPGHMESRAGRRHVSDHFPVTRVPLTPDFPDEAPEFA